MVKATHRQVGFSLFKATSERDESFPFYSCSSQRNQNPDLFLQVRPERKDGRMFCVKTAYASLIVHSWSSCPINGRMCYWLGTLGIPSATSVGMTGGSASTSWYSILGKLTSIYIVQRPRAGKGASGQTACDWVSSKKHDGRQHGATRIGAPAGSKCKWLGSGERKAAACTQRSRAATRTAHETGGKGNRTRRNGKKRQPDGTKREANPPTGRESSTGRCRNQRRKADGPACPCPDASCPFRWSRQRQILPYPSPVGQSQVTSIFPAC